MKLRIFLVCLLTLTLMMTFVAPALAQQPIVERFEFELPTYFNCDDGAFSVTLLEQFKFRSITFIDGEGNAYARQWHINLQGTAIKTVTATGAETIFNDHASIQEFHELPSENLERLIGVIFHITLPGEGILVIDAGRLVFDKNGDFVSFSGHLEPDSEDFICDGLRGF